MLREMRIGVELPHYGADASVERVVSLAVECERLGFDSLWVSDHLVFDYGRYGGSPDLVGTVEAMTMLGVLARETTRVRLGTLVVCSEFRHPIVLAKEAATVDLASGGRLELGMGAGWYEREFRLAGLPFPPAGRRLERLAEAVEIVKRAWTGEPVHLSGRHWEVGGMVVLPRPAQDPRPPIWVGAKGPRAIGVAVRVGDGWNAAHVDDPADYERLLAWAGGSPVRRSVASYARGSAQELVDRLRAFERLGVELAVLSFGPFPFSLTDPDDLARFSQDVLPHLR